MFYNLKNNIKLLYLKRVWRKKNLHNYTNLNNCCDINKIKVGRYTYGNLNVYTSGCSNEELEIGDFCSISSSVKFLLAGEHKVNSLMTYPLKQKILNTEIDTISKGKIIVDDDVWIGENALILSGVHINQGAVIGAGAVVVNDVPPYAIVGGVPAKVIKYRFEKEFIEILLNIDFKRINKIEIEKYIDKFYQIPSENTVFDWLPRKK